MGGANTDFSCKDASTFKLSSLPNQRPPEIYARIRSLQSHYYYNLPPQNNPGEYEGLVRDHLDQALDVPQDHPGYGIF